MTEEQNQVGTLWYMPPEHLYAALMLETSVFDARVSSIAFSAERGGAELTLRTRARCLLHFTAAYCVL